MNSSSSSAARMMGAVLLAIGVGPALSAREKWPMKSEAAQAHEAAIQAHLKDVQERVRPDIAAGAAKGKPWIPWAAKPEDLPQAPVVAFPGAEGGGAHSFGGRGGKVYVVTSVADSGPGTLREACEAAGPRIVVFNVAGIIHLKLPICIEAPYITIAGQTAPGDGVCIADEAVFDDTHDVVIRYLRFRKGNLDLWDRTSDLCGNPVGNIIIDHVSASWGNDQTLDTYRHMYRPPQGGPALKLPTVNDTIQWSIVGEALNVWNHAFGGDWGGRNTGFHHNLFACNTARNPSVAMSYDFNFVDNVLFNWRHRSVDGGDRNSRFNIIDNYFKPGPATQDSPVRYRILEPAQSWNKREKISRWGKAYVAGNYVEGNPAVTADNWAGGVQFSLAPDQDATGAIAKGLIDDPERLKGIAAGVRVDRPFPMAPITVEPARAAYEDVLAQAGDNLPRRDLVDERLVTETRTGKVWAEGRRIATRRITGLPKNDVGEAGNGIITDPAQVGGWPVYRGAPRADLGADGIPGWWKAKYGLDPKDPDLASRDLQGDGYTVMDKYLDGLDPTRKIDWSDPRSNRNTLSAADFEESGKAPVLEPMVWGGVERAAGAEGAPASDAAREGLGKGERSLDAIIEARAGKIVAGLQLGDPAKAARVTKIVVGQYLAVNAAEADPAQGGGGDAAGASRVRELHEAFLAKLAVELQPAQVEAVKNGMTADKVEVTYDAYLKFLPQLTDEQKARVLALLKEAREEAMDCGSMGAKSAVFKKYKGKINVYLSTQGVDVGKAERAWVSAHAASSASN